MSFGLAPWILPRRVSSRGSRSYRLEVYRPGLSPVNDEHCSIGPKRLGPLPVQVRRRALVRLLGVPVSSHVSSAFLRTVPTMFVRPRIDRSQPAYLTECRWGLI